MDLERAPAVAVAPPAPTVEGAPAGVGGAAPASNQALLAALGLGTASAPPPADSLRQVLPTLGPVATVVLDALPFPTAWTLANENAEQAWAAEWLASAEATGPAAAHFTTNVQQESNRVFDAPYQPAPPVAGAPTTFAEALARHVKDEAAVQALFASARAVTPDPAAGASRAAMLRNSVEWVDAGEVNLRVFSATHDGHLRPHAPGQLAWFSGTYDPTLDATGRPANDTGVVYTNALLGDCDGQTLRLFAPAAAPASVLAETLIHEVQHDADQNGGVSDHHEGTDADPVHCAPNWVFESYRTEFNAWSVETPTGSPYDEFGPDGPAPAPIRVGALVDGQPRSVLTDFATARQHRIFCTLVGAAGVTDGNWGDPLTGEWAGTYAHIGYYYVADGAFRGMVDGHDLPTSGNQGNSVRIQALWDAVSGGDEGEITTALQGLDAVDQALLANRATSLDFWATATDTLGAAAATDLRRRIEALGAPNADPDTCAAGLGAPADELGNVVVQPGDTLDALAERYLGGRERTPELAALNGVELGTVDEVLEPGLVLRLPAL